MASGVVVEAPRNVAVKYVVAVSGGVDSVALLHLMVTVTRGRHEGDAQQLYVAHVDHGIRAESAADARFVRALAAQYGLPYISTRLELGNDASEDQAREERYDFLYATADKFGARIFTAHTRDDVIGSIAINLERGTGWRGLAVMNRPGIERPLLAWDKRRIYEYALQYRLEWVEDETNQSSAYLRNRLRAGVVALQESTAQELFARRNRQCMLAGEIEQAVDTVRQQFNRSRYAYTQVDTSIAIELLRAEIDAASGYRPTSGEAQRALLAIKTAASGKRIDIAAGVVILLSARGFVVESDLEC